MADSAATHPSVSWSGMNQWESLRQRVADLDAAVGPVAEGDWPRGGLAQAAWVLDAITHTSIADRSEAIEPAVADAVAGTSVLLSRLRALAPEIVDGPVALDRRSGWAPARRPGSSFRVPCCGPCRTPTCGRQRSSMSGISPTSRPAPSRSGAACTPRPPSGGEGLWEIHLDTTRTSLFPRPWYVWAAPARPDARVREIPTAAAWAEFVSSYPLEHDGLIYPDWCRVARDYDGVHLTLHAVAATQGIELRVDGATIAAPYYGVESTFWLHWAFSAPQLRRVVA